ncbi:MULTISPECIES: flagellar biosynthesis anti-sigma factor FlgM [Paraburkholderia]|jgi:negative regulator of flagellin synthesis FlgM|uniref:Negative regulator of flagellin synthesis n=1 Tax=Paraburkholderia strydomiana TaxID=1245417 RepID=A0ABW9C471_9BURK|nr:flagellar biosynthesis anti-sigma factor FlgM [uncultured Paraburkholderia sp.]CAH2899538.1 MAG: Negative regulator of flagellin synthesis [uncultured Paraburkholderia sp.]CAH2926528.1 MAG: Negative regulator of flagellin synthesis [uncultured Paraburkholderia sp.]
MKIEPSNYPLAAPRNTTQRATNNSDTNGAIESVNPAGTSGTQNTEVSLTSMSALRSFSDPDIDTAKVESIKAELRQGTYKIDSGKIADGALNSVRELLQTRTR